MNPAERQAAHAALDRRIDQRIDQRTAHLARAIADELEKRERRHRELKRAALEKAPRVDPKRAAELFDQLADRLAPATRLQARTYNRWRKGQGTAFLRTVENHLKGRGGDPTDATALLEESGEAA